MSFRRFPSLHPVPLPWLAPVLLAVVPAAIAQAPSEVPPSAPAPIVTIPTAVSQLQQHFAGLLRRVAPSVVTVRAYERLPAPPAAGGPAEASGWVVSEENPYPGFREYGAASGFVVQERGEVLTVHSLLRKPDGSLPDLVDIETRDRQRIVAELVGCEPTVNLAIVQAMVFPNGHDRRLPPLRLGDSDALQPGQQVLCVGDPAGSERFAALATFITLPERDCYQDLLSSFYQQLGAIVPGQAYGGPVIDMAGDVVGVLAPRQLTPGPVDAPKTGVEYALPSKIVTGLYETISAVRSTRSPWLGFAVTSRAEIAAARGIEAFQALPKPRAGILIENVFSPSPAAAADIRPGDFLVGLDAARTFTPVEFQKALYLAGIGTKVKLELWRGGETLFRELVIEQRPASAAPR
jgi:serine protease Do